MTLSETVGEGIIYVAISGGSFHCLSGLLVTHDGRCPMLKLVIIMSPLSHGGLSLSARLSQSVL